jgi:hypothetical protein
MTRKAEEGKMSQESMGKAAVSGSGISGNGRTGPFRNYCKHPALETEFVHCMRTGVRCILPTGW